MEHITQSWNETTPTPQRNMHAEINAMLSLSQENEQRLQRLESICQDITGEPSHITPVKESPQTVRDSLFGNIKELNFQAERQARHFQSILDRFTRALGDSNAVTG